MIECDVKKYMLFVIPFMNLEGRKLKLAFSIFLL